MGSRNRRTLYTVSHISRNRKLKGYGVYCTVQVYTFKKRIRKSWNRSTLYIVQCTLLVILVGIGNLKFIVYTALYKCTLLRRGLGRVGMGIWNRSTLYIVHC